MFLVLKSADRSTCGDHLLSIRLTLLVNNQLVHAAGPKSGAHSVDDSQAGVDVGQELTLALRRVCTILQENDLRLLKGHATTTTPKKKVKRVTV